MVRSISEISRISSELCSFAESSPQLTSESFQSVTGTPPPSFLDAISDIASFGVTPYPWAALKVLLAASIVQMLNERSQADPVKEVIDGATFSDRLSRLLAKLDSFSAPPFTLQRLAELVLSHGKSYSSTSNLFHAIEKLVHVSSSEGVVGSSEYDGVVVGLESAMQSVVESAPPAGHRVSTPVPEVTPMQE
mmetsp:Transcript_14685/g.46082  ORF Transcript_14685/g.46082 Transcript_14685/m.46082 type:complete len:192 (-) Transcript_14685:85-660(-)